MTTPPAAGSGQALPARVVETLNRYTAMCREVGDANLSYCDEALRGRFEAAHAAHVAAIADAIEVARRDGMAAAGPQGKEVW